MLDSTQEEQLSWFAGNEYGRSNPYVVEVYEQHNEPRITKGEDEE